MSSYPRVIIKRRRFAEDIADSILDKVIESGLKAGDRLPTHSQLSKELGVSIPSLREGLSLLSLSGLINITHGAGTTLKNPEPDDYFKMLAPASRIQGVDMDIISDYCNIFIPDLVKAALTMTEDIINIIKRMMQIDAARKGAVFVNMHKELHTTLVSAIKNPLKKSSLQIALSLFYSNPSVIRTPDKLIRIYLEPHIALMKSLQRENISSIESALAACYRFKKLKEDSIPLVCDSFGTGSLGGSFHSMAKRFSKEFMSEENLSIHLELTGGGIDNIKLMEEGKTLLALTQMDIAEAAYKGEGLFTKAHRHLRVVCHVRPLDLFILTLKEKNIFSVYDFKGRRIAMGAEGGDSGIVARKLLHNLAFDSGDYRPYYLSLSNALQGLINDEIDVVFFLAHEIPSVVNEMLDTKDLKFIEIPSNIIRSLEKKNSFWNKSVISPDFNDPASIETISVATVLITGEKVPEDLICKIVSILKEKSESDDQVHFNIHSNEFTIPFHPGVLKCLK